MEGSPLNVLRWLYLGSHSLVFRVKEPSRAYDGAPDNTSLDPTNDLDRQES